MAGNEKGRTPRKTKIILTCVSNPIENCKAKKPVLLTGKVTVILEFIFLCAPISPFTHAHKYQLKSSKHFHIHMEQ